jgi:thioredoxin reductase (NADPH)
MITDIVIIGAGPVGLFAIFQAGMLGMKCHVIDALSEVGGQCNALYPEKPIYDIPACPEIAASDLIDSLYKQAAPFHPVFHLNQQVVGLKTSDHGFTVKTSNNIELKAKAVIIAAGCGAFGPNKPPLENIESFEGKSVFYSVKKRADFAGKEILIAGGGDSAVDWAISLAEIAKSVSIVHRRDKFKAAPESLKKLKVLQEAGKINMIIGYQLDKLIGSDGNLEAVELKDLNNNSLILKADTLLPFFGLSQELGPILDWGLDLKLHHIEVTQPHYETNIPGIYAIGDIATYESKLKLILTGFAEAAHALHHAYARVFNGKALHFEYSTTKGISS